MQSGGEQVTVITGNKVHQEKKQGKKHLQGHGQGYTQSTLQVFSANGFANMPKVNRKTWTDLKFTFTFPRPSPARHILRRVEPLRSVRYFPSATGEDN